MTDKDVTIIIRAKDAAGNVLKGVSSKFKKAGTDARTAGNQIKASMAGAKAATDKMAASSQKLATSSGNLKSKFSSMAAGITALSTGYLALTAAASGVINVFKNFIGSAIEQESVWQRLALSLQTFGYESDSVVAKVQAIGAEMQNVAGIGDEDVGETFTMLLNATGNLDTAFDALDVTLSAMETGLVRNKTAVKAIAEAYGGNSATLETMLPFLREYGAELDKQEKQMGRTFTEAERAEKMIAKMKDTIGGLAKQGMTTEKQINKFKNAIEDTKKSIVDLLIPSLSEMAGAFADIATDISEAVAWLGKLRESVSEKFEVVIDIVRKGAGGEGTIGGSLVDAGVTGAKKGYEYGRAFAGGPAGVVFKAYKETKNIFDLAQQIRKEAEKPTGTVEGMFGVKSPKQQIQEWREAQRVAKQQLKTQEDISVEIENQLKNIENINRQREFGGQKKLSPHAELNLLTKTLQYAKENGAAQEQIFELQDKIIAKRNEVNSQIKDGNEEDLRYLELKQQGEEQLFNLETQHEERMRSLKAERAAAEMAAAKQIADLKAEAVAAEQRGFEAGKAEQWKESQKAIEQIKSSYSEYLRSTGEQNNKLKESNALLQQSVDTLEKDNTLLQATFDIYSGLANAQNLTFEQRKQAMADIQRLQTQISKDAQEALQHMSRSHDLGVQMDIAYNGLVGHQAQAAELLGKITKLEYGLAATTEEEVALRRAVNEGLAQYAEMLGVSTTEAESLLQTIRGISKEEFEMMQQRKRFADQVAAIEKKYGNIMMFGGDVSGRAAELERLYRTRAEETGDIFSFRQAEFYAGVAEAEKSQADAAKAAQDAAKRWHDEVFNATSSALQKGFDEGPRAAVDSLADYLKNKIKKAAADALAAEILGVGGAGAGMGAGIFGGIFGGGGGGAPSRASAMAAAMGGVGNMRAGVAGAGNFGTSFMAPMAMGVYGGQARAAGIAQGGGLLGGIGGGGGMLGGFGPYLGAAMLLSGLFKKGRGAPQSGVAALPQFQGINQMGGSLDVLRGSEAFTRAAFSGRNEAGRLSSDFANARFGEPRVQVEVEVKPGGMFDAEVSQRLVGQISRSNSGGVPRRTGFTNG